MLNSIRQTSKDTIIYGLGNIAVKIVGFLLIPLYTDKKYFSVDDFGVIAMLDISGVILISIMASGLPQSLMRWYWDKDYSDNQKGIFFISFSIQIIVSLLFCLFLFPFTPQISKIILHTSDWSSVIKLLILSSALQAINNLINTLMRVQSKSVLFSALNLSKLLIVLILTIYFIVFRHIGVKGIYLAQVVGNLIFIILLFPYTLRNCSLFFNLTVLGSMGSYGFPLLLANFSAAALTAIDRFSLNSMALMGSVAIYSMAYKMSSVLKLVIVDSIKMAVTPMVLQKMNSPDNKKFYDKTLLYSSYVVMLGIITISLFSYEVIKIISGSAEFWSAFIVVPLLSLSVFFLNMRETSTYGLIIKKKTKIIGIIVVISSALNIVLNILLIPKWDIIGAALATMITQFIYWSLSYHYSQKEYFIPYELRKIVLIFVVGGILSLTGLLVNDINIVLRLIIKLACLISFPFILYLFNFYEEVELKAIKGFAAKWSNIRNLKNNIMSLKNVTNEI